MSAALTQKRSVPPGMTPGVDRRQHRRYSISLNLRYKLIEGNRTLHRGQGTTLNISSRGVLFQADDVPEGEAEILSDCGPIVMEIDWPLRLNGTCSLKFIVRGLIARRDGPRLAVRIQRRELRTTRASEPRVCSAAQS